MKILAVGFIGLLALECPARQPPSSAFSEAAVVAEALRVDPQVAQNRLKVAEAESHVREIQGQKRFQLSLEGTVSGSTGQVAEPSSSQTFATAQATLNAPIPNKGKIDTQVAQALAALDAARQELAKSSQDLEYQASQAYFELWRARDAAGIASENLQQAQRQLQDVQARVAAGDVPPADVLKAQVPVAQDKAALTRADIAASVALQNLNNLIHRDLSASIEVQPISLPTSSTITPEEAGRYALTHSPDVLEGEANLRQAQAGLAFSHHARDIEFALQLTQQQTGDVTAYSRLTTLGLNLTLPLADGGVASEQVKQARLQVAEAEKALDQIRRTANLEAQQAALDVQGDLANVDATQQTTAVAKESLTKAQQSYEAGLTTTRDVLDAQLAYAQARIDENSARYDLGIALARLKQAMGGTP